VRHKVLAVRPLLEVIRQCDVAARSPDRQSSPDSLSGTSERRIPTYRARGRAAAQVREPESQRAREAERQRDRERDRQRETDRERETAREI
jgi:hypothetical protein